MTFDEILRADEVFATGNYGKVQPITRVELQDFQPGPISKRDTNSISITPQTSAYYSNNLDLQAGFPIFYYTISTLINRLP